MDEDELNKAKQSEPNFELDGEMESEGIDDTFKRPLKRFKDLEDAFEGLTIDDADTKRHRAKRKEHHPRVRKMPTSHLSTFVKQKVKTRKVANGMKLSSAENLLF